MRLARFSPLALIGLAMAVACFGCDQKAGTDQAPTADKPAETAPIATEPPAAAASDTASPVDSAAKADTPSPETPKPSATGDKDGPVAVKAKTAADKPADTAVKPAQSAKPSKGSDVSAASFSTWLQSAGSYETGKQGTVTAVLVAKAPYKCNAKYPYKFKLDAPSSGVSYPESTVRGMQVSPKRSSMSIPFLPTQTGKATISGQLSFSICTEERCVIEKRKLSVTVDVK
jgi:hypothetical protein